MQYRKLCILGIISVLTGCGGGERGAGNVIPTEVAPLPAPTVLTGVFLDSPVINVNYETDTLSGITNAQGEFDYIVGEAVTFSIGDLDFPVAAATAMVTPLKLVRTVDTTDSTVLNIVRLFIALDQDGDPNNGITIHDTAKANATQVDFTLSEANFAASDAVINLIFNAGQDSVVAGLVTAADARTHLEQQLIENGVPFGTIAQQDDRAINEYLTANNLQADLHSSGLYYHIIEAGTGGAPVLSSTVEVKYKGYLTNDEIFDQTEGNDTVSFPLSDVIEGWQIAIPLLQKGGSGVFYIPSALAYGAAGSGGIPPNTVLIFEVDLIDFN